MELQMKAIAIYFFCALTLHSFHSETNLSEILQSIETTQNENTMHEMDDFTWSRGFTQKSDDLRVLEMIKEVKEIDSTRSFLQF